MELVVVVLLGVKLEERCTSTGTYNSDDDGLLLLEEVEVGVACLTDIISCNNILIGS